MSPSSHGPLERILAEANSDIFEVLTERISGADLTSLLLEVMRRRSADLSSADVLRRYRHDRFVAPGTVHYLALRRAEDQLLAALGPDFVPVTLSPLAPLGAHVAVAGVDQNRLVTTVRGSEVAGDPTLGLALEAVVRRKAALARDPRSTDIIRLAGIQRVTRAQQFEGEEQFTHFTIFGLVTAGRDMGHHQFERTSVAEHARIIALALRNAGADEVEVALSDFTSGALEPVAAAARDALAGIADVVDAPARSAGRGYYMGFALGSSGRFRERIVDVADGGFVDWSQRLVGSQKERMMISGIGVDRIALATTD